MYTKGSCRPYKEGKNQVLLQRSHPQFSSALQQPAQTGRFILLDSSKLSEH